MAKGREFETILRISADLDKGVKKALDGIVNNMDEMEAAARKAGGSIGGLAGKIQDQSAVLEAAKKKYASYVLSGEKSTDQAKKLAREITDLSGNLKDNKAKMAAAEKAADMLTDGLDDVGDAAKDSSGGFTVMKGALSNLVADGFNRAIDAAKDFATSMVNVSAEVKAENSQFEQTFGDLGDAAESAINRVASSSGIIDTRLKGTATSIYAFARSSGASTEEAMAIMETSLQAAADSAAYYDSSLEDAGETLMSFLKGNFANDAALGLSATETTRNAKAMELFGQKYNDLTEIEKQATLLRMVTDSQKLSGAMGQAAREADGWENVQGNLNEAWRQFKANAGTPFLEHLVPIIQALTDKVSGFAESVDWDAFGEKVSGAFDMASGAADKLSGAISWAQNNAEWLIPVVAGLSGAMLTYKALTFELKTGVTLLTLAEKAKGVVMGIATGQMTLAAIATKAMGAATAFLASPITIAVLAIGALVAAGVALYRNWDTVKEYAAKLGEFLSGVWSGITEKVSAFIQSVKDFFREGFNSLVDIVKAPFDKILGFVDGVIGKVKGLVGKLTGAKDTAASITVPAFAAGGFTNGLSIAGEKGTEAVISFDPAYRDDNLSYWAKAGRMLGADSSDFSLGNGSGGANSYDLGGVTFAPNITVTGKADKQSIMEAIEAEYPEFIDVLEEWFLERVKPVYA